MACFKLNGKRIYYNTNDLAEHEIKRAIVQLQSRIAVIITPYFCNFKRRRIYDDDSEEFSPKLKITKARRIIDSDTTDNSDTESDKINIEANAMSMFQNSNNNNSNASKKIPARRKTVCGDLIQLNQHTIPKEAATRSDNTKDSTLYQSNRHKTDRLRYEHKSKNTSINSSSISTTNQCNSLPKPAIKSTHSKSTDTRILDNRRKSIEIKNDKLIDPRQKLGDSQRKTQIKLSTIKPYMSTSDTQKPIEKKVEIRKLTNSSSSQNNPRKPYKDCKQKHGNKDKPPENKSTCIKIVETSSRHVINHTHKARETKSIEKKRKSTEHREHKSKTRKVEPKETVDESVKPKVLASVPTKCPENLYKLFGNIDDLESSDDEIGLVNRISKRKSTDEDSIRAKIAKLCETNQNAAKNLSTAIHWQYLTRLEVQKTHQYSRKAQQDVHVANEADEIVFESNNPSVMYDQTMIIIKNVVSVNVPSASQGTSNAVNNKNSERSTKYEEIVDLTGDDIDTVNSSINSPCKQMKVEVKEEVVFDLTNDETDCNIKAELVQYPVKNEMLNLPCGLVYDVDSNDEASPENTTTRSQIDHADQSGHIDQVVEIGEQKTSSVPGGCNLNQSETDKDESISSTTSTEDQSTQTDEKISVKVEKPPDIAMPKPFIEANPVKIEVPMTSQYEAISPQPEAVEAWNVTSTVETDNSSMECQYEAISPQSEAVETPSVTSNNISNNSAATAQVNNSSTPNLQGIQSPVVTEAWTSQTGNSLAQTQTTRSDLAANWPQASKPEVSQATHPQSSRNLLQNLLLSSPSVPLTTASTSNIYNITSAPNVTIRPGWPANNKLNQINSPPQLLPVENMQYRQQHPIQRITNIQFAGYIAPVLFDFHRFHVQITEQFRQLSATTDSVEEYERISSRIARMFHHPKIQRFSDSLVNAIKFKIVIDYNPGALVLIINTCIREMCMRELCGEEINVISIYRYIAFLLTRAGDKCKQTQFLHLMKTGFQIYWNEITTRVNTNYETGAKRHSSTEAQLLQFKEQCRFYQQSVAHSKRQTAAEPTNLDAIRSRIDDKIEQNKRILASTVLRQMASGTGIPAPSKTVPTQTCRTFLLPGQAPPIGINKTVPPNRRSSATEQQAPVVNVIEHIMLRPMVQPTSTSVPPVVMATLTSVPPLPTNRMVEHTAPAGVQARPSFEVPLADGRIAEVNLPVRYTPRNPPRKSPPPYKSAIRKLTKTKTQMCSQSIKSNHRNGVTTVVSSSTSAPQAIPAHPNRLSDLCRMVASFPPKDSIPTSTNPVHLTPTVVPNPPHVSPAFPLHSSNAAASMMTSNPIVPINPSVNPVNPPINSSNLLKNSSNPLMNSSNPLLNSSNPLIAPSNLPMNSSNLPIKPPNPPIRSSNSPMKSPNRTISIIPSIPAASINSPNSVLPIAPSINVVAISLPNSTVSINPPNRTVPMNPSNSTLMTTQSNPAVSIAPSKQTLILNSSNPSMVLMESSNPIASINLSTSTTPVKSSNLIIVASSINSTIPTSDVSTAVTASISTTSTLITPEISSLPNENAQNNLSITTESNNGSAEVEIIDLTWLDDYDPAEAKRELDSFAIKAENLAKDNERNNVVSPADSGLGSPSAGLPDYPEQFLCLCGQKAIYVCRCNNSMYCSRECQTIDWVDHQNLCSRLLSDTANTCE